MPRIESLGHVGIYAEDLMKMRDFYSRVLCLTIADEELEERGMVFLTADKEREHHERALGRSGREREEKREGVGMGVRTRGMELKQWREEAGERHDLVSRRSEVQAVA